jgi:hypothetical protein
MNSELMNRTTRNTSLGTRWANIVFGIWVLLSPFVFGFSGNPVALVNNVGLGIAFVLVAWAGDWGGGGFLGLTVPLSIWLFVWPFVYEFWGTPLLWSNVIMAFSQITAAAISDGLRTPPNSDTRN